MYDRLDNISIKHGHKPKRKNSEEELRDILGALDIDNSGEGYELKVNKFRARKNKLMKGRDKFIYDFTQDYLKNLGSFSIKKFMRAANGNELKRWFEDSINMKNNVSDVKSVASYRPPPGGFGGFDDDVSDMSETSPIRINAGKSGNPNVQSSRAQKINEIRGKSDFKGKGDFQIGGDAIGFGIDGDLPSQIDVRDDPWESPNRGFDSRPKKAKDSPAKIDQQYQTANKHVSGGQKIELDDQYQYRSAMGGGGGGNGSNQKMKQKQLHQQVINDGGYDEDDSFMMPSPKDVGFGVDVDAGGMSRFDVAKGRGGGLGVNVGVSGGGKGGASGEKAEFGKNQEIMDKLAARMAARKKG
jgi:hypothetical protein